MPTPPWLAELLSLSPHLTAADEPPELEDLLTVRLGSLGRAFGRRAAEMTPEQRRRILQILEEVQATGSQSDAEAVATGFFEAVLNQWDRGFDLRSVWPDVGPESRAYCIAWNDFGGIGSPAWMRAAAGAAE